MDDQKRYDDSNELFSDTQHSANEEIDQFEKNHTQQDIRKQDGADEQQTQRNIPYYYSYGPYKSSSSKLSELNSSSLTSTRQLDGSATSLSHSKEQNRENERETTARKQWTYPVKKRSGFKSIVASFLAGALVVGSLMFAADKTNLFTGDTVVQESTQTGSSVVQQEQSADGSGSNVQQAALDGVVYPDDIASMVSTASPAVVKIETYVEQTVRSYSGWNFFFGVPNQQPQEQSDDLVLGGQGTGFFFDSEGYILTNQHVIDGAKEIEVTVKGFAEPFKAETLGSIKDLDLAVLKIEGDEPFPTLPLGDSEQAEVGDWVVAIGNPYGFDHTVTVGVLSAKEREIPIQDENGQSTTYNHLLQTDASINPGNSGGPLLNLNGEVIGINTAVSTEAQGIGFAIPTSTITSVLENLKNDIPVPKPYVGIYMSELTEAGLGALGIDNGIVITGVIEGSPAESAGLQPYDVILQIDGEDITSAEQIQELISSKQVGDKITMRILRDDQTANIGLTIGDQNAE